MAEDTAESPNPGLIYDLFSGVFRPQVVRLALQLDVFTPLADGPQDAATVASACECHEAGMTQLLDALAGMQVLSRHAVSCYALTPSAATFLVRGRPAYAGDLILAWTGPAIWDSVAYAVRTGQPGPFEEYHEQDAWLESFSVWRIDHSLALWQAAGIAPQPEAPRCLLDIACGCAIKSLALAQRDPELHVTGVDTARVLPPARDLAARLGLAGQSEFLVADLLTADLGVARYDICLLGQITDYLTPAQNQDLFRRVHQALRPGGTLVLDVPMTGDQPTEWTQLVSLLLWVNSGGGTHSFETYRGWLEAVGFHSIRQLSDRWLAAGKAA